MVLQPHSHFLSQYFLGTNWNELNDYNNLTLSSRSLLDFTVLGGISLNVTNKSNNSFLSSLTLQTLIPTPSSITLNQTAANKNDILLGQLSYAYSTVTSANHSSNQSSFGADRLKLEEAIGTFTINSFPIQPILRPDTQPTWQGGKRVDKSDFLLYGRIYAPSPKLDALYIHRISETLQSIVTLVSVPSPPPTPSLAWPAEEISANSSSNGPNSLGRLSELEIKLQRDVGKWSNEFSYSFGDSMFGLKGLYNFGDANLRVGEEVRRLEAEEEVMSSGLKGRWSVGGEVFFSAQERSAGVSTGIKFSTIPDGTSTNAGGGEEVPTVITATLNPIMGHLSTAYSVGISPLAALATRFDFNLFSYDADLTIGGEILQRRKPSKRIEDEFVQPDWESNEEPTTASWDAFGRGQQEFMDAKAVERKGEENEIIGAIKFRASTNTDISVAWEGRLGDFLISLGVVADLRLKKGAIKTVGVGIQYWG